MTPVGFQIHSLTEDLLNAYPVRVFRCWAIAVRKLRGPKDATFVTSVALFLQLSGMSLGREVGDE